MQGSKKLTQVKSITHVGWIPCINGHLDFGLMKPGIAGGFTNTEVLDRKTTRINYAYEGRPDSHARKIIMQSKVDWKDCANPKNKGLFRIFVLGKVSFSDNLDERKLQGKVYVYPAGLEPESRETKKKLPRFKLIHSAEREIEKLNEIYSQLESDLDGLEYNHIVSYTIQPDGIIFLNFIEKSSSPFDKYEQYLIKRQVYYYLKYSLHEHKHHDNQMDALMTIVQMEESEIKQNEGLKLLGQLKRELTSIKRTFSRCEKNDGSEPQGIISYMSSLNMVLKNNISSFSDCYDREKVYIEALIASFEVQSKKSSKYQAIKSDINSIYRTRAGITLALFSAFLFVIIKPFLQVGEENIIIHNVSVIEAAIIFIFVIVVAYYFMDKLRKNEIKDKLEGEGFKKWVDKWYISSSFGQDLKQVLFMWIVLIILIIIISFFDPVSWFFVKGYG